LTLTIIALSYLSARMPCWLRLQIHIHLVDFFLLSRSSIAAGTPDMNTDGVHSYEQMMPKDVVCECCAFLFCLTAAS
jgi:hypothetical protein